MPGEATPEGPSDGEESPEAHDPVQQDGRDRADLATPERDERDDEAPLDDAEAAGVIGRFAASCPAP